MTGACGAECGLEFVPPEGGGGIGVLVGVVVGVCGNGRGEDAETAEVAEDGGTPVEVGVEDEVAECESADVPFAVVAAVEQEEDPAPR